MRYVTYRLHSQGRSCFHFFPLLLALHMQDTFMLILNFEVGHFTRCFFLPFGAAMKGIHSTQLCCHISFLSFVQLTTCFLSNQRQLLNSRKCQLFCLHIQHTTHGLFEQRTLVSSSEAAVCRFCLLISLQLCIY